MQIEETGLEGLLILDLETFEDARGFFRETFRKDLYAAAGISLEFPQQNHSHSKQGVLRGLHFRLRQPQAQIVTVFHGRVYDVAVDLRPESSTFGAWFGTELSADEGRQLYMDPGFAHGFCVLSETADLHYQASRTYDSSDEAGIHWSDPDLSIDWPVTDPVISPRDLTHPRLRDIAASL